MMFSRIQGNTIAYTIIGKVFLFYIKHHVIFVWRRKQLNLFDHKKTSILLRLDE